MRSIGLSLTALFAAACRPAPAAAPYEPALAATVAPALPKAAAEGAPPNRVGVPGSTRGTVACGASRCAAPGQSCVLRERAGSDHTPAWQCVSRDRELEGEQRYACDDASDCVAGQACCLGFESAFVAYACSVRSGVGANCALESCVAEGGAPCPTGQACRRGECAPVDARATCADGQRCPASAPICLWAKGLATCAGDASGVDADTLPNELRMSCASNEDCGAGLTCCSNAIGSATSCRVACDLANNLQLCQRDADCRSASSQKLRCVPASAENSGHFPAWVRVCSAR